MPQPGPYTKTELRERLKFVRAGVWNDRVLVFMDREIHARRVTVNSDNETVHVIGTDIGLQKDVIEDIDPRDVTRIC